MLKKFIHFDDMITPVVVKFLYYALLVLTLIMGLVMMIVGLAAPYGASGRVVFMGMIVLLLGPVILRVYVELILVIFSILEELKKMNRGFSVEDTQKKSTGEDN